MLLFYFTSSGITKKSDYSGLRLPCFSHLGWQPLTNKNRRNHNAAEIINRLCYFYFSDSRTFPCLRFFLVVFFLSLSSLVPFSFKVVIAGFLYVSSEYVYPVSGSTKFHQVEIIVAESTTTDIKKKRRQQQ